MFKLVEFFFFCCSHCAAVMCSVSTEGKKKGAARMRKEEEEKEEMGGLPQCSNHPPLISCSSLSLSPSLSLPPSTSSLLTPVSTLRLPRIPYRAPFLLLWSRPLSLWSIQSASRTSYLKKTKTKTTPMVRKPKTNNVTLNICNNKLQKETGVRWSL